MRSTYKAELPWPPSATSANKSKSGNWWEKSKAAKSYKTECTYLLMHQKVRSLDPAPEWLPITVTFHPPSNRRLDPDNAVNRIKAGLDAFSEAIGVDDGRFWPMTLVRGEKVAGGKVVIEW